MTRRGGTTSEGGSRGGDGVTPDKQTEPHQSSPPRVFIGASCWYRRDAPVSWPYPRSNSHSPRLRTGSPQTRSLWVGTTTDEPTRAFESRGHAEPRAHVESRARVLRNSRLCWSGRGVGRGDRNLLVTRTGGSGGGSRWGLWYGLVCLSGVTPSPPREPPSLVVPPRRVTIHPLNAVLL